MRIPRLRKGSFFPELLEPRRGVDRALWGVIMTADMRGTSTRKVDDLAKALGCDSGVSKSTVSRICMDIDREVAPSTSAPSATRRSRTCSWTRLTSKHRSTIRSCPIRS